MLADPPTEPGAPRVIELVTLDLDDTLWDARPALARAEHAMHAWLASEAPRVSARYSVAEFQDFRRQLARVRPDLRHDFTALRHTALAAVLSEAGYPPSLATAGLEVFIAERSAVELYPEVDRALSRLAQRYRLVALTNGNADLRRTGVAQYFEFAIAPSDVGTSKPDPRMFGAVMARAAVAAAAVAHVGDEPYHDVEGAHRARVAAVWMNRDGRAWPESFRRAQVEISDLNQLVPALSRLERGVNQGDS